MVQIRFLWLTVLTFLLASVVLAAPCSPPASGDWNITNTSVLCDNGTTIVVNGSINLDNATLNVTNGTSLNVSTGYLRLYNTTAPSTLLMNESSSTNASVVIFGGSSAFFSHATITNNVFTYAEGAHAVLDHATITGYLQQAFWCSAAEIELRNGVYTPTAITIRSGRFNATNVTITTGTVTFGTGSDQLVNVTLADVVLNATSIRLNANSTLSATNLTTNVTLNAWENTSLTLARATIPHVATNGTLVAANSALNLTSNGPALTLTSVNATTLAATGTATLTRVNATTAVLAGDTTFNDCTAGNLTLNSSGSSSGVLNVTGTLFLNDHHELTLNDSAIAVLASNGTGHALLKGNLTVTSLGSFGQNLTRLLPFTLLNESGGPVGSSEVTIDGLNETLYRNTDWAGDDIDFRWESDIVTNLTLYNSTWSDTIELGPSTPNVYNYTGYTLDGETYNFTLNAVTKNLTITRYSDAATWTQQLTRQDRVQVWSGTTASDGTLDLNLSVNNNTCLDDFLLKSHNQNTTFTLANTTPMSWRIDATPPSLTISATSTPIYAGTFWWNVSVSTDTATLNYTISNATATWTNGTVTNTTLNASGWLLNRSYDGLFLPAGTWTLNVTVADQYGNARSSNLSLDSEAAIRSSLTSSASQSATIGGLAIGFTFNVTTKGAGSVVKAFLNLTDGALTFNSHYARLVGTSQNATVSSSGSYAGAGNVTLPAISSWPSYVALNLSQAGLYNDALTLSLTPYEGLSAGTYSGSYGFGVFG